MLTLPHVQVETADAIATVWLAFPGSPVNALSPDRLVTLDRAIAPLLRNPHLDAVVIRSALPGGFCGGYVPEVIASLETDADATAFATTGQWILNRLAAAEVVTVAFMEGPCLGPGLELALACDYRLAVAGPDSWFGFPEADYGLPPCWGGSVRWRKRFGSYLFTGREAQRAGLVHDAFTRRRGKIELRTWLDRIQANPRKPRRRSVDPVSLAAERVSFRAAVRDGLTHRPCSIVPEASTSEQAVEAAIRGQRTVLLDGPNVSQKVAAAMAEALSRGRVTPLEASQARERITFAAAKPVAVARVAA